MEGQDLVFVMETEKKFEELRTFQGMLGVNNKFSIDCATGSEKTRVMLLGKDFIDLEILSFSLNHITTNYFFVSLGGFLEAQNKHLF